jgi:hypothetical protein
MRTACKSGLPRSRSETLIHGQPVLYMRLFTAPLPVPFFFPTQVAEHAAHYQIAASSRSCGIQTSSLGICDNPCRGVRSCRPGSEAVIAAGDLPALMRQSSIGNMVRSLQGCSTDFAYRSCYTGWNQDAGSIYGRLSTIGYCGNKLTAFPGYIRLSKRLRK